MASPFDFLAYPFSDRRLLASRLTANPTDTENAGAKGD